MSKKITMKKKSSRPSKKSAADIMHPEPMVLAATKIRGKQYGAGLCFVNLFGTEMSAVAVAFGKKRWISTAKDCAAALEKDGLSDTEASLLIKAALYRQLIDEVEETLKGNSNWASVAGDGSLAATVSNTRSRLEHRIREFREVLGGD